MMLFVDKKIKSPLLFKDEPHFQYEILHRNVHIKYKNEVFYPLVSEFPASPGIDLIFFSDKGEILLAELKHNSIEYDFAQMESVHHCEKYKENKIVDIIKYAETNALEVNSSNLEVFKEKCDKSIFDKYKSINDLCEEGKLKIIALFNGYEPSQLIPICADMVFIIFDENELRIKNIYYEGDRVPTKKIYTEYEQHITNRKSRRKPWNSHDIKEEISNNKYLLMETMLLTAISNVFIIKPGTGDKISFSIQLLDTYRKKRSLVNVYKDRIEIPGNLYNQRRYLGVEKEDIDKYFIEIRKKFDEEKMCETKAGTLRISIKYFDEGIITAIFNEMMEFRSKAQNID